MAEHGDDVRVPAERPVRHRVHPGRELAEAPAPLRAVNTSTTNVVTEGQEREPDSKFKIYSFL